MDSSGCGPARLAVVDGLRHRRRHAVLLRRRVVLQVHLLRVVQLRLVLRVRGGATRELKRRRARRAHHTLGGSGRELAHLRVKGGGARA